MQYIGLISHNSSWRAVLRVSCAELKQSAHVSISSRAFNPVTTHTRSSQISSAITTDDYDQQFRASKGNRSFKFECRPYSVGMLVCSWVHDVMRATACMERCTAQLTLNYERASDNTQLHQQVMVTAYPILDLRLSIHACSFGVHPIAVQSCRFLLMGLPDINSLVPANSSSVVGVILCATPRMRL